MAGGLDVRCDAMVFVIRRAAEGRSGWEVVVDDGTVHAADAVISTCPLPQTFSLLFEAGVDLPRELVADDYDRTIALLTVLDGPSAVPPPGAVQQPDGIFSFVVDNSAKGVSAVPAVTLHAGAAWSLHHWDHDRPAVHDALVEAARPWLGSARLVETQVKRWRFATPRQPWPDPCWVAPEGSLIVAGDAFAGPKIEGAFNSGLAAAAALTGG
jgi:predicted NAD/FAD-dependent oxidoreductase